jgi:hypothetical protein
MKQMMINTDVDYGGEILVGPQWYEYAKNRWPKRKIQMTVYATENKAYYVRKNRRGIFMIQFPDLSIWVTGDEFPMIKKKYEGR